MVNEHDVIGFDIPMDQASTMGFRQATDDLEEHMTDKGNALTAGSEKPGQVGTLEEFHNQVEQVLIGTEIQNSDGIWMGELSGGFGFVPETINGFLRTVGRGHHFDGDSTPRTDLDRSIDFPHTSMPNSGLQFILAIEDQARQRPISLVICLVFVVDDAL